MTRFCAAENLSTAIHLSTMRGSDMLKNYGVLMMTSKLAGLPARALIVADEQDCVLHVELVKELTSEPDYAAALGKNPEGRKVKGVIHWVPAEGSVECEVRLYDRLFRAANPEKAEEGGSFLDNINPDSLQVLSGCRAEPSLGNAQPEDRFQFEREGYFCADLKDSRPGRPVFNRTVSLRDSWGS